MTSKQQFTNFNIGSHMRSDGIHSPPKQHFTGGAPKKRNDYRVVLAQHVVYPRTKIGEKITYDTDDMTIVTPIYQYHTENMLPPPRKSFSCEAEYKAWRGFKQHADQEHAYDNVDVEEPEPELDEQNAHLMRD